MESEFSEDNIESASPATNQASNVETDEGQDVAEQPQGVAERLERVEGALELVLDHLQTVTRGTEILEAARTRNMLSAIALGFSAIALIVFGSINASDPDIFNVDISRFSVGMALLFLAAVLDVASGMILHKAISGAIFERDATLLVGWQGPWRRFFSLSHWKKTKKESTAAFYYQALRSSAFGIYLLAGAFLIWALFYL